MKYLLTTVKTGIYIGALFMGLTISGSPLAATPVLADSSNAVAPNAPLGTDLSANWAGYVATGQSYTSVSGTWVVPIPNTTTGETKLADNATWVGIGGVTGNDLIQSGTQALIQNGQVTYQAWVETLPQYLQPIPLQVNGGDSVSVSLTETGSNLWTLSFKDNTTGQSYQSTITYASSNSSAEWIEEMPVGGSSASTYLPLDNFGTAQFTNAETTVSGNLESAANVNAQPLTMVTQGTTPLATTSAIGSDGASFTVTRTNATTTSTLPTTITLNQGRGYRRTGVAVQGFTRPTATRSSYSFTRRNMGGMSVQYLSVPYTIERIGNTTQIEFTLWR